MDKIILILGASSDIGMAFIEKQKKVLTSKVTIIAQYRTDSEKFSKVCESNSNVNIVKMQCNLADSEDTDKLIAGIKDNNLIPTHILHLAASQYEFMKIKKWDEKKVKESMDISVFSFAKICNEFLPAMAKAGYGRVVAMLSSVTLGTPPKFLANYTTVKYALWGFVRSAAAEYADKGVTVNGLSPSMMDTKFVNGIDERIREMAADKAIMKRAASVEETVAAIEYLLSDEASYVNGVNFNMSGGDYM